MNSAAGVSEGYVALAVHKVYRILHAKPCEASLQETDRFVISQAHG